jgi:hypothetical protein
LNPTTTNIESEEEFVSWHFNVVDSSSISILCGGDNIFLMTDGG